MKRLRLVMVLAALLAPASAHASYVLDPPASGSGWHRRPVTLEFSEATRFRVDGGAWRTVQAVVVATNGLHTVEYEEGQTVRTLHLRLDLTRPTLAARSGGATRITATTDDAQSGVRRLQVRVGRGRWRTRSLEEKLFDGTRASFERWQHEGAGSFDVTDGGALRTSGGIGLLWYPEEDFGDAAFRLRWRDALPSGQRSNGGVFIRFPPAPPHPCDALLPIALSDFTWHAVACGHEIQINDGDVDPQQTGSVYGFAPLDKEASRPAPFGRWNDYEVRTVGAGDYEISVVRNGRVINRFVNTPGQRSSQDDPSLSTVYPPTDAKQFATGHFGLQNHGDADVIEYRDVRVLELGPRNETFQVPRARRVRVRAVDAAGNRSRVVTLRR